MSITASAAAYPSAGMVVLIGLVVVFAVLLLLTFVFWLFGKAAGGNRATASTPTPAPTVSAVPAAPAVTDGVPDEVVAVIAAAVAAMSSEGTQYTIRRIRPAAAHGTRPVWAAAGIAENTRPF